MSTATGILAISPELSGLALLKGHKSTLEGFGKKLEEKLKSWRSLEVLMSAKQPVWDELRELSEEIRANSSQVIILSEGLLDATMRAANSLFVPLDPRSDHLKLQFVSSNLSSASLTHLAQRLQGRRACVILAFQGAPSPRLLWCFEKLYASLSLNRTAEEVRRRIIVAADLSWQDWAKSNSFRLLALPPRSSGRYLFFSEPLALVLWLADVPAWQCVEGARSMVRAFDKKAGLSDQLLAYSALREIALGEQARECLLLPDETFLNFARWWRLLSEDSRQEFAEELGESRFELGAVLRERFPEKGRQWVTEIAFEKDRKVSSGKLAKNHALKWPLSCRKWGSPEPDYEAALRLQREEEAYQQPSVTITLRRADPMSVGALFAFFEGTVSACHRLADLHDEWSLLQPREAIIPTESPV